MDRRQPTSTAVLPIPPARTDASGHVAASVGPVVDSADRPVALADAARLVGAFGGLPLCDGPPTLATLRRWAVRGLRVACPRHHQGVRLPGALVLRLPSEIGPGGRRYTTRRSLRAFIAVALAQKGGAA